MDLREIMWEVEDWMHLDQDRNEWLFLVNEVRKLRGPWNASTTVRWLKFGNQFLTNKLTNTQARRPMKYKFGRRRLFYERRKRDKNVLGPREWMNEWKVTTMIRFCALPLRWSVNEGIELFW
jgi:hypothetical protein